MLNITKKLTKSMIVADITVATVLRSPPKDT